MTFISIRSFPFPVCLFALVLLLMLSLSPEAATAVEADARIVRATGNAAISGNDVQGARERAIVDAKRNAVDQVGSQVVSKTVVENFELVRDRIIVMAEGYVHGYEVIDESRDGNYYRVTIEAKVSKKSIEDDAARLYREMKKPRVMVVISEVRGKEIVPSSHAENVVGEFFIAKGFTVFDPAATGVKVREEELHLIAEGDMDTAAEVGRRAGAEVIVAGTASIGDVESVRGVLYSSKATVSIRALRTDNASVYALSSMSKVAPDAVADAAQRKALEIAADSAARDIFWKIVKKWEEEHEAGSDIEVVLKGVDFSRLRKVIKGLEGIPGVVEIIQRSFDSSEAVLTVTYKGDAMGLAEKMDAGVFQGIDLEVISLSSGKISLRVK